MSGNTFGKLVVIGSLTTLVALGAPSSHAKIYKTVDADGNVVFTDIAPKDESSAIEITNHNSYTPVAPPPAEAPAQDSDTAVYEEELIETIYEAIKVVSPRNNVDVRANDGRISVKAEVSPKLDTASGHELQVLVDGEVRATSESEAVVVTDLHRGTHQLELQVINANGEILIASRPTTFTLMKVSALSPIGPQRAGGATYGQAPSRAPNVPPQRNPSPGSN